jgi:hypothetical protein
MMMVVLESKAQSKTEPQGENNDGGEACEGPQMRTI